MNDNGKAVALEKILSESRKFREECKKTIRSSKMLYESTTTLTEELQYLSEEAAVLLEERIVIKEEALAIAKVANGEKEISKLSSVYLAIEDEKKIVREMHKELSKIKICKNNSSLSSLQDKFYKLSFLEYQLDQQKKEEGNPQKGGGMRQ